VESRLQRRCGNAGSGEGKRKGGAAGSAAWAQWGPVPVPARTSEGKAVWEVEEAPASGILCEGATVAIVTWGGCTSPKGFRAGLELICHRQQ